MGQKRTLPFNMMSKDESTVLGRHSLEGPIMEKILIHDQSSDYPSSETDEQVEEIWAPPHPWGPLPAEQGDKTQKERNQMIITQFYSKSSPDLVTFCDNLEKELKIQDKLFEQQLQKHHQLVINEMKLLNQDTMDIFEDTISILSITDNRLIYFRQLTPMESRVAMLVHEVMTSPNAIANSNDKTTPNFFPYVDQMVAKSDLDSAKTDINQKRIALFLLFN
uniref:Uncharacterized protein n=1 Tax=Romanomermis culicivorax TaxID=13658 RepID=A0A915K5J3_ROMCU